MKNTNTEEEKIAQFERHYDYDASYLRAILNTSPKAFVAYQGFSQMGNYRGKLPAVEYFVAAIATLLTEDCGPCIQLNIKMAKEAGVSSEIINGVLNLPNCQLPPHLDDLRRYAIGVATNDTEKSLLDSVRNHYSEVDMVEIAFSIASVRVYPCLKRALGFIGESCQNIQPDN